MKKLGILALLFFIFLTGCSGNENKEIIGTWYSTRPDTLIIKKGGVFTSDWLTSGIESSYTVKNNSIIFTAPDKSTYEFQIQEEGNNKVLYYESKTSSLKYTYYTDKSLVDEIISKQKEEEKAEKEKQEETQREEHSNTLVGEWEWIGFGEIIEFTADGKYKHTNIEKENIWDYELIDSETLKITKDTGESYTTKIKIKETDKGYELTFEHRQYLKK